MAGSTIEFGFTAVIGFGVEGKDQTEMQERCQQFVDQWIASAEDVNINGVQLLGFEQPDGEKGVEQFNGLMRESKEEAN
jgi:hypothetical protein